MGKEAFWNKHCSEFFSLICSQNDDFTNLINNILERLAPLCNRFGNQNNVRFSLKSRLKNQMGTNNLLNELFYGSLPINLMKYQYLTALAASIMIFPIS